MQSQYFISLNPYVIKGIRYNKNFIYDKDFKVNQHTKTTYKLNNN